MRTDPVITPSGNIFAQPSRFRAASGIPASEMCELDFGNRHDTDGQQGGSEIPEQNGGPASAVVIIMMRASEPFPSRLRFAELQYVGGLGELTGAPGVEGPDPHPKPGLVAAERELSIPKRRWARSVPAVAEPPSATERWLAAGRLDSHLGGARTLILPGRGAALAEHYPELTLRTEPAHSEAFVALGPATGVTAAKWQLAFEALLAWKEEQGIEDERLTLKPEDLGLRLTYLATGPTAATSGPDCDLAAPFA